MNEYSEKRTVSRAVPVDRRVGIETQYDSVVTERQPTSGVAIAALVIAAVAAAVIVTILILNNQQSDRDQQLAQERERLAASQQQPSQQAPIIVMPQSGAPGQTPAPSQVAPPAEASAPTSIDVEIAVTSKLLDDKELHSYPVNVKVKAGTVTLSGSVPTDELKARAERVSRTVKGVRDVTNNITVQP